MKRFLTVMILTVFMAMPAFAGFRAYNASTDLKIFDAIQCSTGLTCTREKDKLKIVSSPTISTGSLSIVGAEAGDATLTMSADESDDSGDDWRLQSVASGNAFTISNDTSGSQVAKLSIATSGNVTFTGSIVGHKQNQVAATATTLTAAQCGSSIINTGAVQVELPEASTVLGCRYTFITGNASNFDVNPDDADQILVQTNAAGDAMRNATLGNAITIEAISASQWAPVSVQGTWSDIN